MHVKPNDVFFLGGLDGEMVAIREWLTQQGVEFQDHHLSWGARASDYEAEIGRALANHKQPVLVELTLDLAESVLTRCVVVDHHGERAGLDQPSSLEQVCGRLGYSREQFTANRWWMLVAANDKGHIRAMRALNPPASAAEIRAVRTADLKAQGVTDNDFAIARAALASRVSKCAGRLTIARCSNNRTGLVAEMMEPFFGGPGFQNLLVLGASEVGFYGAGEFVRVLAEASPPPPNSWYGGSLPEVGFWGARLQALSFDPAALLENLLAATKR